MKNLFNLDNPFMQYLARVFEMMIANVLFLVCCLPVFTIGASITALQKVTQDIIFEMEDNVFKTFFRAFRENFKQATIAWLIALAFLLGLGCNLVIAVALLEGNSLMVVKAILLVLAVVIVSVCVYLFPLMVRYDNTLRSHCINAAILAIIKLPRTIGMVLLTLMPFLIVYISLEVFFDTLVFWVVIGFSFVHYISGSLLKPVFAELEHKNGEEVSIMK